jgi:hypothetical protein
MQRWLARHPGQEGRKEDVPYKICAFHIGEDARVQNPENMLV